MDFTMIPAGIKPWYFLAPVALLVVAPVALLVLIGYRSQRTSFQLTSTELQVPGILRSKRIPRSLLEVEKSRIVDLQKEAALKPTSRTWGVGLPGYQSGWFRLRSGERALLHLTQREPVVYLPTRDGFALLLSIEDPEKFLEALRVP